MTTALVLAAAVSAVAAIVADWNERKPPAFLLLKPLTTILIAAIAFTAPASDYRSWLLLGLGLALAGDVCLMFAGNAFFIGGLSSFLLAHLAFVVAFAGQLDGLVLPWWSGAILLYGLLFFGWLLPKAGRLKLPALAYGLVILAMTLTAAARWQQHPDSSAALALAGAALFFLSDSALAIRRFVRPYRGAQGAILSTYWLGIGLIAASAFFLV